MRLSTGNLSNTFGLSAEALRYYEHKGLLKPKREKEQGYRSFDRVDIQRVCNIKRMQALGFSLDQIKQAYQGVSEETLHAAYQHQFKEFTENIRYQARIYKHFKRVTETLAAKDSLLFMPRKVHLEKAYVRVFPSVPDMWEQARREKSLQSAFHHQPLVSFCTFFDVSDGSFLMPNIKKGLAVFASDAHALPLLLKNYREINAENAVECVFRLVNGHFDLPNLLGPVAKYLDQQNLMASDVLFTHKLLDFKDESGNVIHYARLITPVLQKE